MTETYETLLVSNADGITTIAFNRPEKRNAMSPQLHREMFNLLTDLRYDEATRVVILTGKGDNFSAGQDLKQYGLELGSQSPRHGNGKVSGGKKSDWLKGRQRGMALQFLLYSGVRVRAI